MYFLLLLVIHAPLEVRSTKRMTSVSRVDDSEPRDCFINGEVIGFQFLLDSTHGTVKIKAEYKGVLG